MILPALAAIVASLCAAGAAAAFAPLRAGAACAGALLPAAGAAATLVFLLSGAAPEILALPVGLPGAGALLALDPLSGFFLLLVFGCATASGVYALGAHEPAAAPFQPVFVAAMALAVLAADAFTLLAGFEAMSLASWAMVAGRREDGAREAGLPYLGMAAFSAACLIPAFALLSPDGAPGFAAMRAAPPDGWRAWAVLALALLGAGSKAGLAPLHVWLPAAHPAAPSQVSALMSGAMTKVALYVLARVLFDLCGPAQPLAWGLPLLAAGAASAVLGALRAATEADLKTVLACSTVEHVGLMAIGLGLALLARGADLQPLAALALGGALLHAMAHAGFKTLLFLCAGSVQHGAGTRMLSRLGGLIRQMPVTSACALAGCASLAGLPLSAGFAGEWMLFQSAFAAPRAGGLPVQLAVAVAAAAMALAIGLGAAASVRLIGVAFLGRPRTPRGSAAEDPGAAARTAMIGAAGFCAVLGLLPGAGLALAAPALRLLLGSGLDGRAGLSISPLADAPGYVPLGAAAVLAAAAGLAWAATRRLPARGERRGPAWGGGFAAPPPWLPFGDPATQYGAASFAQPLTRALAPLLSATEHVTMAAPGDPRPSVLAAARADPAERLLFRPLARLRLLASTAADRAQFLTVRASLGVMFACVVAFLAALAWRNAR